MEPWKTLYRYWFSKRVGERPPARRDIDPPVEIPSLVANLMLMEKAPDGSYRYRLAGTEIESRAGVSLTGKGIGASEIPQSLAAQWRSGLDAVWRECAPKLFVSRFKDGVAVRHITLMLPLATETGETEHVLIGCFFDGYVAPGVRAEGLIPEELGD